MQKIQRNLLKFFSQLLQIIMVLQMLIFFIEIQIKPQKYSISSSNKDFWQNFTTSNF
jgi:hypothetical protein